MLILFSGVMIKLLESLMKSFFVVLFNSQKYDEPIFEGIIVVFFE